MDLTCKTLLAIQRWICSHCMTLVECKKYKILAKSVNVVSHIQFMRILFSHHAYNISRIYSNTCYLPPPCMGDAVYIIILEITL